MRLGSLFLTLYLYITVWGRLSKFLTEKKRSLTTFCSGKSARGESQIQKLIPGLAWGESAVPRLGHAWPDTALCWRPQCSPLPATWGAAQGRLSFCFHISLWEGAPGFLELLVKMLNPPKSRPRQTARPARLGGRAPRQPRTQEVPAIAI